MHDPKRTKETWFVYADMHGTLKIVLQNSLKRSLSTASIQKKNLTKFYLNWTLNTIKVERVIWKSKMIWFIFFRSSHGCVLSVLQKLFCNIFVLQLWLKTLENSCGGVHFWWSCRPTDWNIDVWVQF